MTEEMRQTGTEAQEDGRPGADAASPATVRQPSEPFGSPADAGAGPAAAGAEPVRVYRGTGVYISVIVGFLTAAALVILMAQNTSPVVIHWLVWSITVPAGVVVLTAVLAGSLVTVLGGLSWRRKQRWILSELEELRRLRERAGPARSSGEAQGAQGSHLAGTEPS